LHECRNFKQSLSEMSTNIPGRGGYGGGWGGGYGGGYGVGYNGY
jgi:hypothetical protein